MFFAVGFSDCFGRQSVDDLLWHPSLRLFLLMSIPKHKDAAIIQKVCDGSAYFAVEAEAERV